MVKRTRLDKVVLKSGLRRRVANSYYNPSHSKWCRCTTCKAFRAECKRQFERRVDAELIAKGKDVIKDFDASKEVTMPAKRLRRLTPEEVSKMKQSNKLKLRCDGGLLELIPNKAEGTWTSKIVKLPNTLMGLDVLYSIQRKIRRKRWTDAQARRWAGSCGVK